jgi:hypothetical protein
MRRPDQKKNKRKTLIENASLVERKSKEVQQMGEKLEEI